METRRRCYWGSCGNAFMSEDRHCLQLAGNKMDCYYAHMIDQLSNDEIKFGGGGKGVANQPIRVRIVRPLINNETCFCATHGKVIRKFEEEERAKIFEENRLTIELVVAKLKKYLTRTPNSKYTLPDNLANQWRCISEQQPNWYWPLVLHILESLLNSKTKQASFMDLTKDFDWKTASGTSFQEVTKQSQKSRIKKTMNSIVTYILDLQIQALVPHTGAAPAEVETAETKDVDSRLRMKQQMAAVSSYDIDKVQLCHVRYAQMSELING